MKVSATVREVDRAVLIIGFGQRKTQQLGTIGLMDCPRCGNTSEWPVHRERTYFSLFFIPLIPYSTRYLLSCPVCRESREISAFMLVASVNVV